MERLATPKIALFLPALTDGGAEQVMVTLANAFADRNIRTQLVLGKAEGPYLASVSQQVEIIDLNAARMLKSVRPLSDYLKKEKPAAMLSTQKHANLIAVWAVKKSRSDTRLILREPNVIRHRKGKYLKNLITHCLMRRYYPLANGFIAVSKDVREDLVRMIKLPPDQVRIINNPVDILTILAKAQEPLEHPFLRDGCQPLILSLGRLNQQKNYPLLINAFEIIQRNTDCRLIILGEGDEREKLERMISTKNLRDSIDMPGFVTNPFPYMRHAKVIVSSSSWEGLPNILIQALVLGKKIVATNCPGGSAEILSEGRYGRLVPPDDPAALVAAIKESLQEAENPEAIQIRAQDFILQGVVEEYLQMLLPDSAHRQAGNIREKQ